MKKILLFSLLLFSVNSYAEPTKQKPLNVCINQTNGKVSAKAKCSKAERAMVGYSIQESCVKRSETTNAIFATWAKVSCNTGEYLFTHGIRSSTAGSEINEIKLLYEGEETVPYGVDYYVKGASGEIQVTVEATCCAE